MFLEDPEELVMQNRVVILIPFFLVASATWAQQQPSGGNAQASEQPSMPGMEMPAHYMSGMKDMPMSAQKNDSDASAHAMHAMEGHMDMGPHMKMTSLHQPKPGDAARAQHVAEAARKASEKYIDYHAALAEG
jgi:hypothetical protein